MPDAKDIALLLGCALIGAGVGAYDWRWAAIVLGVMFSGFGMYGYWRKYGG
jgi:hypothetical protein